MSEPPERPDDEPREADANWLRQDDPAGARPDREPDPTPLSSEGADYSLVEPEGEPSAPEPPAPPRAPVEEPRAAGGPDSPAERPKGGAIAAEARVEQVWTRWGEWWPTILTLTIVVIATIALAYAAFDPDNLQLPMGILLVGGLLGLVLSYPLLISLERPVRMTPEQAVQDYFGALCHHRPHFRRMWLLLSAEGRVGGDYGSFEGFKAYWKRRLAELRGGQVSGWTPLVFQIHDFASEKSAGKTEIEVRFTVSVFARGRRGEAPLATIPAELSLVRGPDRMWYLDRGTLPRPSG